MNRSEIIKDLTCTRCKEVKETYSEIEYSQGERVCLECKKDTEYADRFDFDNFMNRRLMR